MTWKFATANWGSLLVRSLLVVLLLATGCSASGNVNDAPAAATPVSAETPVRETIRIPLSLYVVSDADDPDSALSSERTAAEVEAIAADIGQIWAQADVVFDPVQVQEISLPDEVLLAIAQSLDTDPFFSQVGSTFDVPNPGVFNGFYVREAGGVNGFAPVGSRAFFVVDQPTVHDERVSSHEIGHLLGLHHALEDAAQLMFSGTNGIELTEPEQQVARYVVQGMLDGAR